LHWASTVSREPRLDDAIEQAATAVRDQLGGEAPDLAVVFVSSHHGDEYERLPAGLRRALGGGVVLGCSAGGVIGGGSEVEGGAGLSVTGARLPGVEVVPFHLRTGDLPAVGAAPAQWERVLRARVASEPHFLLLPDPLTFDAEALLRGLDSVYPSGRKVGGLASGTASSGENVLYVGASSYRAGAVGVALHGDIEVDTVVAQGCRPIGDPMFVTSSDGNLIRSLDGRLPLEVLRDVYDGLVKHDRDLFRRSLFLGVVMRAGCSEYGQGDFLVRNLIGLDEDSGALAVGADVADNMVVQFQLRDARTSSADLDELLVRYASRHGDAAAPRGSLMFSCLGRGAGLYGRPDHDTGLFQRHLGQVPLGGFFCNGEIGEVQGRTFLHGYTSSFGLFRERS
jgi:small ligand-binding sensory domain FIST